MDNTAVEKAISNARYAILAQMMDNASSAAGLPVCRQVGRLDGLLPQVAALDGVTQPENFHPEGDALTHTLIMLDLAPPCRMLRWAVLLHDIGKATTRVVGADGKITFWGHAEKSAELAREIMRQAVSEGIVLSGEADLIEQLVAGHMRWHNIQKMRRGKLLQWLKQPSFACELKLHYLDCLGSNGDLSNYEFAVKQYHDEIGPIMLCNDIFCQNQCKF